MRRRIILLVAVGFWVVGAVRAQQTVPGPALPGLTHPASPVAAAVSELQGAQDPFRGSVSSGAATSEEISLTLQEAIQRGLKNNLGLLLRREGVRTAEGDRWKALSGLLPLANAEISSTAQQTNLDAFGFHGFAGVPNIVGPFGVFDARAYVSQPLVDLSARQLVKSATASRTAANLTYQDARNTVVAAVASLYIQAQAAGSRVEAVRAQLETAQILYNQAVDFKNQGVVPAIEVLRAQVELQAQQQQLVFFENQAEKNKLELARAIGLPTAQRFRISENLSDAAPPVLALDDALARAYESRADYLSLLAQVRAAEASTKAIHAKRYPTLSFRGDYGDIGKTPGSSHGTFSAAANLNIPLFQAGRVRGEMLQAEALLEQRKSQLEDRRSRIEYELRVSFLDLQAARQQVDVAKTAQELARQQIEQAQDRFSAGVTSNIEVVQAQEALATSNENYINALYLYNGAKISLARSLGRAEETVPQFLGGGTP